MIALSTLLIPCWIKRMPSYMDEQQEYGKYADNKLVI